MKRKLILYILFFFITHSAWSQLVQVSGYIYLKDSATVVPYANIVNKKTMRGCQSSHEGFFTILMTPGDTLEVTAIGFKKLTYSLPKTVTGEYYDKNLYLSIAVYDLKGAKITITNWDKFKKDFESTALIEEKEYVVTNKYDITASAPVRTAPGYTLNGPFTWLSNKFSKKAKELEKLNDIKDGEYYGVVAAGKVDKNKIMEYTKISSQDIDEFLGFCVVESRLLANMSDYDVIKHYEGCVPSFNLKKGYIKELPKDSVPGKN